MLAIVTQVFESNFWLAICQMSVNLRISSLRLWIAWVSRIQISPYRPAGQMLRVCRIHFPPSLSRLRHWVRFLLFRTVMQMAWVERLLQTTLRHHLVQPRKPCRISENLRWIASFPEAIQCLRLSIVIVTEWGFTYNEDIYFIRLIIKASVFVKSNGQQPDIR